MCFGIKRKRPLLTRITMKRARMMKLIVILLIVTLISTSYIFLTKTPIINSPLQRIDFAGQYYATRVSTSAPQYENEDQESDQETERCSVCEVGLQNTSNLNSNGTDSNKTFLMTQESENLFHLGELGKLLQKPWTQNKTNINALFSKELSMVLDSRFQFATKNNTQRQDAVKFIHTSNRAVLLPHDVYRALPAAYPFGEKKFKNCSVVGSGGILTNSSCGSQIDSSEFVIRFNMPPLPDFIKDAGQISNITTINPSQIELMFNALRTKPDRERFLVYIKQYGSYFWTSGFGLPVGLYLTRRVLRTIRSSPGVNVKMLLGHPTHWTAMNKFWTDRGVNASRLSSGAYWLSSALIMCDEVHLYGFWPFSTDQHGNPLRYHYYEDKAPVKKILKYHHFDEEFKAILDLHAKGIVQLHVDKCHDS